MRNLSEKVFSIKGFKFTGKLSFRKLNILLLLFQLISLFLVFFANNKTADQNKTVFAVFLIFAVFLSNIIIQKYFEGDKYNQGQHSNLYLPIHSWRPSFPPVLLPVIIIVESNRLKFSAFCAIHHHWFAVSEQSSRNIRICIRPTSPLAFRLSTPKRRPATQEI